MRYWFGLAIQLQPASSQTQVAVLCQQMKEAIYLRPWNAIAVGLALLLLLAWGGSGALAKSRITSKTIELDGTPPALSTLAFANPQHGYLGGSGFIGVTRNGGARWTEAWKGSPDVIQIDPVSPSQAVAVTATGLLATANGGRTWHSLSEPNGTGSCTTDVSAPCILNVHFVTPTRGYAVGARPSESGINPAAVMASPSGKMLYVANASGTVTAYSLNLGRIAWFVKVGEAPSALAISPHGHYLYVADQNSNAVATVDTQTHHVVATTSTLQNPCALALKPNGELYVSGASGGLMRLSGGARPRVEGQISGVSATCSLAWSPDHRLLYSASDSSSAIQVTNTSTNRLMDTFDLPASANGVVVSPRGRHVYVATMGSEGSPILQLNAKTGLVEKRWRVPGLVWNLTANWKANELMALSSNRLDRIRLTTGKVFSEQLNSSANIGASLAIIRGLLYAPAPVGVWRITPNGQATRIPASGVAVVTNLGVPVPQGQGSLWVTNDGGKTWTPISAAPAAQSVCGLENGDLLASRGADVWKSANRGRTWTNIYRAPVQSPQIHSGLTSVLVCGGNTVAFEITGWGAAMGHEAYIAFQSLDGGVHFTPAIEEDYTHPGLAKTNAPEGPGTYPGPFTIAGKTPIWSGSTAAVPSTAIGIRNGSTVLIHLVPEGGIPLAIQAIAFPTPRRGYVLTNQNRVLTTNDGGRSWHQVFPTTPSPVEAISFVGRQVGFGLGTGGQPEAILRTEDGGQHWQRVGTLPTTAQSQESGGSLAFLSRSQGFAINPQGELYETRDGGRRWIARHIRADRLAFVGQTGCILSNRGTLTSVNGGASWHAGQPANSPLGCAAEAAFPSWKPTIQTMGSQRQVVGVVGSQVAWFQTEALGMMRTVDGGRHYTVWSAGAQEANIYPMQFDFPTVNVGFFLTLSGSLYRSADGGRLWTLLP